MELDPQTLSVKERYKILIGCIIPRPIAFISTLSIDGTPNLAPFSFYNGIGSNPMLLMFCPANQRDGKEKDTLRNAKTKSEGGQGEFVVNLASELYMKHVAGAAAPLPPGESEFDLTRLDQTESARVQAPRVKASPIAFECQTRKVLRFNEGVPGGPNLVIGEVVWIHLAEGVRSEQGYIDPSQLLAVGRMGGTSYCRTRELFDLPAGETALSVPDPIKS